MTSAQTLQPWKNKLIRSIVRSKEMTLSEKAKRLKKVMQIKGETMPGLTWRGPRSIISLIVKGPAKTATRAASRRGIPSIIRRRTTYGETHLAVPYSRGLEKKVSDWFLEETPRGARRLNPPGTLLFYSHNPSLLRGETMGAMQVDVGPAQVVPTTASSREGARRRLLKAMIDWHQAEHSVPMTSGVGLAVLDTGTAQFKMDPFKMGGVAPPGMEALVKRLKKNPKITNPWAVAWSIHRRKKMADVGNWQPVWPDDENKFKVGAGMRMRRHGEGFYLPGGGRFRRHRYNPGGGWFVRPDGTFMRHVPPNVAGMGHTELDPFKMGYTNLNPFKSGHEELNPFKMGSRTPYWIPGSGVYYPKGRGFRYYPGGGWHKQGKRWVHSHVGDSALAHGIAPGDGWMIIRAKQKKMAAKICAAAKAGNPKAKSILQAAQAMAAKGDQRAQMFLKDAACAAVIRQHRTALPALSAAAHKATHASGITAMERIAGF